MILRKRSEGMQLRWSTLRRMLKPSSLEAAAILVLVRGTAACDVVQVLACVADAAPSQSHKRRDSIRFDSIRSDRSEATRRALAWHRRGARLCRLLHSLATRRCATYEMADLTPGDRFLRKSFDSSSDQCG